MHSFRCTGSSRRSWRLRVRTAWIALLVIVVVAAPALAGSRPPPPPRDDPPPPVHRVHPHPRAVGDRHDPPPLPIAMRVVYAPFYVTALVLRYGVYYLVVAPFEVFGRTLGYGVEGGVRQDDHDDR